MKVASLKVVAVVAISAVSIAACGSSGSTATRTKTVQANATHTSSTRSSTSASSTSAGMTKAQAAKAYLAAVNPGNAVAKKFDAYLAHAPSDATGDDIASHAAPLVKAFQAADHKLLDLAQEYPPAATDLKAVVNADAPIEADLTNAATVNSLNVTSWVQQVNQDGSKEHAAGSIVRSDLGLPQRTTH